MVYNFNELLVKEKTICVICINLIHLMQILSLPFKLLCVLK